MQTIDQTTQRGCALGAPFSASGTVVALACSLLFAGCASIENARGRMQIRSGDRENGVESLRVATQKAPTDAAFKVDYLLRRDESAREGLLQADTLRAQGELAEAQLAYERVLRLDAGNDRARAALNAMPQDLRFDRLLSEGERFLEQGRIELAADRAAQVLEDHSQNRRAARLRSAAADAQASREHERARALGGSGVMDRPVTLHFNDASLRVVFEALSRSAGLNILLDRDVRPAAKVSIFVKDIPVGDAIDFILLQNQLERRMVNGNTLMVYPSSDAKKAEYEDLTIRSFQVTNTDIRYVGTMLRSMLKLREVSADERTGILVIRDTPEKLRLASRLIAVHDVPDPEIMLEVEILEITTSRRSNLGILPPSGLSVTTPGAQAALTLGALRALRSDHLLASPLSATVNFKLEDGEAKLLASPRIRARNKEKARIMIGDRVPTITNTVTPIATGSSVVTGSVSYQDVGLKLEFEPQVYSSSEVGIKISLEVSNIAAEFTDAQGGRSYQIGTRNASTNLRLKDGQTQILGGLISDQDRNTASKIPGLGHLPVVGRIFGNNDGIEARSEIILSITPRIVRNLASHAAETRSIFSGTFNVPREKPILAEPIMQGRPGLIQSGPTVSPTPHPAAVADPATPGPMPASAAAQPASSALLPVAPAMFVRPAPAVR